MILLRERAFPLLPTENLPPRNVIILQVVAQPRLISVKTHTDNVKSLVLIGIVNPFDIRHFPNAGSVPNCPEIK